MDFGKEIRLGNLIRYRRTASPTAVWFESRNRLALDLLVLSENTEELRRLAEPLTDEAMITKLWSSDDDEDLVRLSARMQRLLANFLAATSALADHSRVHVRKYSGELNEDYGKQLRASMLSTPTFHLVRELRNAAQHLVNPVAGPRVTRTRREDGTYEVCHGWYLEKDWLLELKPDWPDIVMSFFDQALYTTRYPFSPSAGPGAPRYLNLLADSMGDNDVDVIWLATKYTEQAQGLTEWLLAADLELHGAELVAHVQELKSLEEELDAARHPRRDGAVDPG